MVESIRRAAVLEALRHSAERHYKKEGPISEYFGENVFSLDKMQNYLSRESFEAVSNAIKSKKPIGRIIADDIADGMKKWAMEKGATHYTHLFQPMTGATAEKHEAFISVKNGVPFEEFKGSTLIQQEPDASSFPNGGLRNTFEARGYSAWDPNSPAFILEETLCIPSVFVAYTGEALDMKTPNLKALDALDKAATSVAQLFDPTVTSVGVSCGLEQEYFLVDEALFNARPDLQICGRTIIGHVAAKDQQLSDHYFGAIPSRVECFMKDFETEAYRLGIQLKTRHNEVAPNQFECAPVFCDLITAIDQNMLLMIIMNRVAERHHLKVLFHEKPFDGVNGSGKHVNWSLITDKGKNLLNPGDAPMDNQCFWAFYSSVVRAVYRHHLLLMTSVSSLNNSYRLGGNEAPPAVMSVFSGSVIYNMIKTIMGDNSLNKYSEATSLHIAENMPEIQADDTDRNRTSPFAFIGNRFEFRALGASMNATAATYILDSVIAESLNEFKKRVTNLKESNISTSEAVSTTIKDFLTESKNILFEGNGYSPEWIKEAERRGLKGVKNVPDAFDIYIAPETAEMYKSLGVLTQNEIDARYEVVNESYVKKLQIEARIMENLCKNIIIPASITYLNTLSASISSCAALFGKDANMISLTSRDLYLTISNLTNSVFGKIKELNNKRAEANTISPISERAKTYSKVLMPILLDIRKDVDKLEEYVSDDLWPLPKYRELLSV